jgi:hypothetical protein
MGTFCVIMRHVLTQDVAQRPLAEKDHLRQRLFFSRVAN